MKTRFYSIEDQDILETYFGEDSKARTLADLGPDFGELLFDGELACIPQSGDTVVFDGDEYNVVCLVVEPKTNTADFIVQPRLYIEADLTQSVEN